MEALESIDARIDALLKTGGWIPVSERLPEKTDVYQVLFEGGGYWLGAYSTAAHRWLLDDELKEKTVTHWADTLPPLPEAK